MARALVLAVGWLGDAFWATRALGPLAAALPGAELHVALRPGHAALAAGAPGGWRVHGVTDLPSDRRRERSSLRGLAARAAALRRAGPWDLVVDLLGNRYSALFTALLRPRASVGRAGATRLARLAYDRRVDAPEGEHLARRPLRVAAAVAPGADLGWERPAPVVDRADWPAVARGVGLAPDATFALLAPGAGWPGKRWPVERWAALARRLAARGLTVVASGGPDEADLVRAAVAGAHGAVAAHGAPVEALVALVARARVVVANDSGPAHLAAAAGTPTVALFSATNPARYRPLGPRVTVLRGACPDRPQGTQEHCHARPAWPCPASCWDALPVDVVEAAATGWLAAGG